MDAFILSYALDTNGQNARFVAASRKHGDGILRALAVGNSDPAGVVARFQQAAAKTDNLRIRSAHRTSAYFEFPGDIEWTQRTEQEIRRLANEADVIHLNNSAMAVRKLRIKPKPMLLHHHGSMFRGNPERMLQVAQHHRMVQAVSTVDLLQHAEDGVLHWLPTAYDIDALQALRNERRDADTVRVVHCPTNRALKGTDAFLAAVDDLTAEGLPIEVVMVEGQTHAEAMAVKATADVVFDQVTLGYGCNSVEAWGMGIPVISGGEPWTIDKMRKLWGTTPFYSATRKTLKQKLRAMVLSRELRAEYAQRGLEHVRKYHDERPALATLAELYVMSIKARERPRIQGKSVQFMSARKMVRHVDGVAVDFSTGVATVTDVDVVEKLRRTIKRRPLFGIDEVA